MNQLPRMLTRAMGSVVTAMLKPLFHPKLTLFAQSKTDGLMHLGLRVWLLAQSVWWAVAWLMSHRPPHEWSWSPQALTDHWKVKNSGGVPNDERFSSVENITSQWSRMMRWEPMMSTASAPASCLP